MNRIYLQFYNKPSLKFNLYFSPFVLFKYAKLTYPKMKDSYIFVLFKDRDMIFTDVNENNIKFVSAEFERKLTKVYDSNNKDNRDFMRNQILDMYIAFLDEESQKRVRISGIPATSTQYDYRKKLVEYIPVDEKMEQAIRECVHSGFVTDSQLNYGVVITER